ncbi:hypothetical protein C7R54_01720 [Achromobacter aloeverae]|uniref:Uncharacterized protein n=2 Tax=Achromobacter aloeverae TaxID=1750518 RepID=A0A4Q1HNK9_9BURK|nr:hypothetical protein C7R54_01720 [Achromobacter aloeverae]
MIICLLMMGVLFSLSRSGIAGVTTNGWAAAVTCVAVTLNFTQPLVPGGLPVPVRLLGGILLGVDMVLYFAGTRQFFGLGVPKRRLAVLTLVYALALATYWYVWTDYSMRTAVISTMRGLMAGVITITVWRHRPMGTPGYPYLFTVAMAGVLALMHVWRAAVYFLRLDAVDALVQASTVNTIYFVIGLVTLPGVMLGIIMMIHDRILRQSPVRQPPDKTAQARGRVSPPR